MFKLRRILIFQLYLATMATSPDSPAVSFVGFYEAFCRLARFHPPGARVHRENLSAIPFSRRESYVSVKESLKSCPENCSLSTRHEPRRAPADEGVTLQYPWLGVLWHDGFGGEIVGFLHHVALCSLCKRCYILAGKLSPNRLPLVLESRLSGTGAVIV